MNEKSVYHLLREEQEIKLKGGLYHYTQVKMAYNSNKIEGSTLSEEQTRFIYETKMIDTKRYESAYVDDIIETVNHFACFNYLLDIAKEELSEDIIKEFHKLLKSSTEDSRKTWFNVGDYKQRDNIVGIVKTTKVEEVKSEMSKLLAQYK